jgi:peptide/nickel transport system substrate-binding protein
MRSVLLAAGVVAAAFVQPAATLTSPAAAQTLRIAMAAEPTSADPHHYAAAPNSTLQNHLYDSLAEVDEKLKPGPGLAESWTRRDDRTWVFRLRESVRFTNGDAFGAPDVVFSYCRTLNNESELVSSFSRLVRRLKRVEALGEHELLIETREPEPLLLSDLSNIAILPRRLGRPDLKFDTETNCGGGGPWPTQAQFNDSTAAIGTGPYRQRSFSRGGVIELERHEQHWGPKPHWREVRLQPVTAAGPRLAGLLAGDFDVIEAPATGDIPRIRGNTDFKLAVSPTTRLIFLQLDTARSPSPFVAGGTEANPLRDPRVRQALSLAIDRRAIVDRVMDGLATSASQFLPDGMFGTIPGVPVLPYDPARARKLLAEAGYPSGFALTLHATNNRYVNDARIAQALGQYLNRIGIRAEVDAMPSSVFFTRRGRRELSVAMGGWAADAQETMLFFRSWLATTDRDRGIGSSNYGGYSDPAFDGPALASLTTMDPDKRRELLQQAGRVALESMPVLPLHFESAVWAFRRGLSYPGRVDQTTLAQQVRPE